MAQSHKTNLQAQFVERWMATRHYDVATNYDVKYLVVANQVLDVLLSYDLYFSQFQLKRSDLVPLAVTITAYFEDFINETGYFRAFVTHNHERFGDYLPFYAITEDYDPDYINPEDLSFLTWHWLMQHFRGRKMFSPTAGPLIGIGADLCMLLEEMIEEMPALEDHERFLTVGDEESLFRIRRIMEWISQGHYLFGALGFEPEVLEACEELRSELDDRELANVELLEYDLRIGQLFSLRCCLGGLTTCEWTARILRCSDALRDSLNAIRPKLGGYFVYMGKDDRHYFFQHHPTARRIHVVIASVDVETPPGEVWFMSVILWKGEFWVQGASSSGFKLRDVPQSSLAGGIPELLMTAEEREQWLDAARLQERKFLEVIGDHLQIFATPKEAYAAQERIFQAINEEFSGHPSGKLPPLDFDGFEPEQPLAMFFIPGMGVVFCPYTPVVVDYLRSPSTSNFDQAQVTNTLFKFVHPFAVDYILTHYPTDALGWPGMRIDVPKDAKFLSTYFLPEQAGPPVPLISFTNPKV